MHPQNSNMIPSTSFPTMSDKPIKEAESGFDSKSLSDRMPTRIIMLPHSSNSHPHLHSDPTHSTHPHNTNFTLHAATPQTTQRSLSHAHASSSHKSTSTRHQSGAHHQFDFRQLKDNIAASDLPAWANWAVWNVEDRNAPRLPRYVYEHALCEQMDETTALAMYTNVFEESPLGTYTRPVVTSPTPISSETNSHNTKHHSSPHTSHSRSTSAAKRTSDHKARFSREQEWEDLFKLPIGTSQFVPQLVNTDHLLRELEDAIPVVFKAASSEQEMLSTSSFLPRTSSGSSSFEDGQSI